MWVCSLNHCTRASFSAKHTYYKVLSTPSTNHDTNGQVVQVQTIILPITIMDLTYYHYQYQVNMFKFFDNSYAVNRHKGPTPFCYPYC